MWEEQRQRRSRGAQAPEGPPKIPDAPARPEAEGWRSWVALATALIGLFPVGLWFGFQARRDKRKAEAEGRTYRPRGVATAAIVLSLFGAVTFAWGVVRYLDSRSDSGPAATRTLEPSGETPQGGDVPLPSDSDYGDDGFVTRSGLESQLEEEETKAIRRSSNPFLQRFSVSNVFCEEAGTPPTSDERFYACQVSYTHPDGDIYNEDRYYDITAYSNGGWQTQE